MTHLSDNERIKTTSRGLRGGLATEMHNALTGNIPADEQQLIKFHGAYVQDDRDRRAEREAKKLEWAYSYMIRLRIPGGDITAEQWLALQDSCERNGTGTIKITTRQTIQFHGVVKARMKPTMQDFDALGLDAIAACGDVNRNVMSGANPALAPYHAEVHAFADKISTHLLPKTGAFKEVWLDGEKLEATTAEPDPLYEDRYLPRKFKIAIAIPPHNENDVFANDIGLIAIGEGDQFHGFNVSIGGGLGATHGNPQTYPRRGTIIGYVPKEHALEVVWQIAAIQRDHGNRTERRFARLKYTVDKLGTAFFIQEITRRSGIALEPERPYLFTHRGDPFGWVEDAHGLWHYGVYVENGVVVDKENYRIKAALRAIAATNLCALRFTGNQNVMLVDITPQDKPTIDALLHEYGINHTHYSDTRKEAIACVALPTCPLALAEGQRYLPELLTHIEALQAKHGLTQPITTRMTGCPNGCGRPYLAEIGFVGKAPGRYVMRLGGDYAGERLNFVVKEEADEAEILSTLDHYFAEYAAQQQPNERFGDYIYRHYNPHKDAV